MNRKEIILQNVKTEGKGLEIGPSFSPICPKKEGFDIEIIDHCSKEELIKKYESNVNVNEKINNIEEVDYVWKGERYPELTGKKDYFDYIVASHLIEHCVDMIDFLNDCTEMLKTDGIISLIIPDKRYEFDFFREVTSVRAVIDQNRSGKKRAHSLGALLDYNINTCLFENSKTYIPPYAILSKDNFIYQKDLDNLKSLINDYDENNYKDCHSWIFTPVSFRILIYELNMLGYINLEIASYYTDPSKIEFYVQLKKSNQDQKAFDSKHLRDLHISRRYEENEIFETEKKLLKFAELNKYIYIYGAGKRAKMVAKILDDLSICYRGFVVSEDQQKADSLNGYPIKYLSEVSLEKEEVGIVLGVSEQFLDEVKEKLEDFKFKNYITL